jgi:hypothetical protein
MREEREEEEKGRRAGEKGDFMCSGMEFAIPCNVRLLKV